MSNLEGYTKQALKAKQLFTYAATSVYNVGDIVIESDNLYRCNTQILIAEAFTISKWDLIGSATGAFIYQGVINLASDFPTPALVVSGWVYVISTDVTDNDATKTNTGQSFLAGDTIAWNGTTWDDITGIEQFLDNGTDKTPIGARGIDILTGEAYKINSVDIKDVAETLTNKTIDGDDNTIQDLTLTSIKTIIGSANKVISRNVSGVVIDATLEIDASNNLDLKDGGLKDTFVTTAIKLGDADNTSLETENKTLVGGINELSDSLSGYNKVSGFDLMVSASHPDITWNDATRTMSFSVKSGSSNFYFWANNVKYTKTTTQSLQILDETGTCYIIFGNDGELFCVREESMEADNFYEDAIAGLVYWGKTAQKGRAGNELHGKMMSARTHAYNHLTYGARYQDGLNITGLADRSPTYTNTTSGHFWDEDIQHNCNLQTEHLFLYRLGADGEWTETVRSNNVSYNAGGTYDVWNEETGGAWQLTEGTPLKDYWIIFNVFLPALDENYRGAKIIGQNAYANVRQARAAIDTELASLKTNGLPTPEIIFKSAWIVDRSGDARALADGSIYINLLSEKAGSGAAAGITDHDDLTGIDLAASGKTYGHINDQVQTIAGLKDFLLTPTTSTATPTLDNELTRKDYVDDGLDLKANDSEIVHKTGNETIAGEKTLTDNLILDDGGSNTNSYKTIYTSNNGGVTQTSSIQGIYGADPYLRISVPNDSGVETSLLDLHDTKIAMTTDNTVDLGASASGRLKDVYIAGSYYGENLGATASRFTKGWVTDIESTNIPTINGVSINTNTALSNVAYIDKFNQFSSNIDIAGRLLAGGIEVIGGDIVKFGSGGSPFDYYSQIYQSNSLMIIDSVGDSTFGSPDGRGGEIYLRTHKRVGDADTYKDVVILNREGNAGFFTNLFGTSAISSISIGSGTAPTTSIADGVQLWSADLSGVAGKAGLNILGEDGTQILLGGTNTGIQINSTTPRVNLYRGAAGTDAKNFDFYNDTDDSLSIRAVNDALSSASTAIKINKTGFSIDNILFPAGTVGIGLTPTANMTGLSIESGLLTLKETTTPTADTNYGKIYTKNDNKLYFQSGDGTENEIAFVV